MEKTYQTVIVQPGIAGLSDCQKSLVDGFMRTESFLRRRPHPSSAFQADATFPHTGEGVVSFADYKYRVQIVSCFVLLRLL